MPVQVSEDSTTLTSWSFTPAGTAIMERDLVALRACSATPKDVAKQLTTYRSARKFSPKEQENGSPSRFHFGVETHKKEISVLELLSSECENLLEQSNILAKDGNLEQFQSLSHEIALLSAGHDELIAVSHGELPQGVAHPYIQNVETVLRYWEWRDRLWQCEEYQRRFYDKLLFTTKDFDWILKNGGNNMVIVGCTNPLQLPWDVWGKIQESLKHK